MATKRTVRQVQRVLMTALAGVLLILALGLFASTYRMYGAMREVRAERIEAEASRAELSARVAALTEKLTALKTERGVEEHIRTTYPWVRDGEVEFIFVAGEEAPETIAPAKTLWQRVRAWLPW